MFYKLEENDAKNVLVFLSRLNFSGDNNFVEIDALQKIRYALSQPIEENENNGQ